MDELKQAEFEMEALFLPVVQLVKGAQHDVEVAGQIFFCEEQGGAGGAGAFVGGDLQQLGGFAAETAMSAVAQIANQLPCELRGAVAGVEQRVDLCHHGGAVVFADRTPAGAQRPRSGQCPSARESARLRDAAGRLATGAEAMAWSMMESASRMEPSPASASRARAASSASTLFLVGDGAQLRQDVVELHRVES